MTNKTHPCDTKTIESFLNDQLERFERDLFSSHLETCESCRTELDRRAAEPEFWSEAANLLSNTFNSGSSGDAVENHSVDPRSNLSLRTIIDWLSPTDNPEMLGRIGEFEVSGIVGIGGMGSVLKGFDPALLRVVAIKVMAPHLANNGSARTRFEREARAAAAISHPNVIDIFRVDEKDGLPYLVMPFARGPSLQKRIDSDGPLSTIEVVQTGRQIASGLAAAHEQGLVHRDIKPANILLSDGLERLLITDFGVARAMDDVSMTQTGLIAGTPQYMSPEQASGEWVDHRSDQFSLGAVLYTACTGRPPFRAEAPFAVLRKVTDNDPRPIREINPEIPVWLESLIHRLLHKQPAERFEDAEEVAQLFEKCLAHLRQPTQIELPQTVAQLEPAVSTKPKFAATKPKSFFSRTGFIVSLLALISTSLASLAIYFSGAPDIAGNWQGEEWQQVQLSSVEEANSWYAGTFVDADGNKGAIHLEWSPVSRRFDGRWSVGSKESGTIVLRSGDNGSVRGAILMDPESANSSDSLRLRDFSWKRGGAASMSYRIGNPEFEPWFSTQPSSYVANGADVVSPVAGIVRKVAEGLRNGADLSEGDLILEIEIEPSSDLLAQLKWQLDMESTQAKQFKTQAADASKSKKLAVRHAIESASVAQANYRSKEALIQGLKAEARQKKLNFERSQRMHKAAQVSQAELEVAERDYEVAASNLESLIYEGEALKQEWQAQHLQIKEIEANSKSKVESAERAMRSSRDRAKALEEKINSIDANPKRIVVNAPNSGTVSRLKNLEVGMSLGKSDFILNLRALEESTIQTRSPQIPTVALPKIVAAPVGGTISKIAEGLIDGRFVSKGDFLFEIEKEADREVEERIADIKMNQAALKAQVAANRRSIKNQEETNKISIQVAKQLASVAKAKFLAKENALTGFEAKEIQARRNLDRQRKLFENGLKPQRELEKVEKDWNVASSDLKSTKLEAEALNEEWQKKRLDINLKESLQQVEANNVKTKLEIATARLQQFNEQLQELQAKTEQNKRTSVLAPMDGYVSRTTLVAVGQRVKESDELLRILPSPSKIEVLTEYKPPVHSLLIDSSSSLINLVSKFNFRVDALAATLDGYEEELKQCENEVSVFQESVNELEKAERNRAASRTKEEAAQALRLLNANSEKLAELLFRREWLKSKIPAASEQLKKTKADSDMVAEFVKIELAKKRGQLKQLNETVSLERMQYEEGDRTKIDLTASKLTQSELEASVKQLEALLRRIEGVSGVEEKSRQLDK